MSPDNTRDARRPDTAAMRARRVAAVTGGKLALLASRSLGKGGGTALPGLVAEQLYPSIARDLALQIPQGVIAVSGTNGKTTTCRMLGQILSDYGMNPVRNESGSNLMRGIASALVQHSGVLGHISGGARAVGLFEIDEAALPGVVASVSPSTVLLLNLFRDQLDRYGEVATVARLWASAVSRLPATSSVIVNADDPLLVHASESATGAKLFFGVDLPNESGSLDHASDVKACPRCGGEIHYSRVSLGHLGNYACPNCELRRPDTDVEASDIVLNGVDGSSFRLHAGTMDASVRLPLPGLYNIYNATAAAAAAWHLGVPLAEIAGSLTRSTPAFGRMESIEVEGRRLLLALAKNPAGLNEVLRAALAGPDLHLLVMLNDNTADGHDVSWIWDADIEGLAGRIDSVVFGGTRAADMALRFKYASLIDHGSAARYRIETDTGRALDLALKWTPAGSTLIAIPTYTALLDVRSLLAKRGFVKQYWRR